MKIVVKPVLLLVAKQMALVPVTTAAMHVALPAIKPGIVYVVIRVKNWLKKELVFLV